MFYKQWVVVREQCIALEPTYRTLFKNDISFLHDVKLQQRRGRFFAVNDEWKDYGNNLSRAERNRDGFILS